MTTYDSPQMPELTAQLGDKVTVSYIGTLDNGRVFDQTEDDPRTFTLGDNEVFPALETEIIGMKIGEVKNIFVPASEAFGPRQEENLLRVHRNMFPAERELHLGTKLSVEFGDAGSRVMRIVDFNDHQVTLDGNHELAGWDLTFALQLDAIVRPSACRTDM